MLSINITFFMSFLNNNFCHVCFVDCVCVHVTCCHHNRVVIIKFMITNLSPKNMLAATSFMQLPVG